MADPARSKDPAAPENGFPSLASVLERQLTREALMNRPRKIPTGFEALDRELGGGLSPGLIVLGGSPNLGKSTFAIQLADNLSRRVPVLYYSMEMTPDRIAAKLVSRELFLQCGAAQDGQTPMSADNIISNARLFSGEDWDRINRVRLQIQERTGNLYVFERLLREDGVPIPFTARNIASHVHRFIALRQAEQDSGLPPPLVMVDYLQILQPPDNQIRNERQVVEDSLNQLVALAREGFIVFLISSLSRGNYDVPLRMDSFKETGGIEYSADILLGLQFQATRRLKRGQKLDIQAEKRKRPREVELAVLKQRYGSSENAVPLLYYSQYDCFEPDLRGPSETAAREASPAPSRKEPAPVSSSKSPPLQAAQEPSHAAAAPVSPAPESEPQESDAQKAAPEKEPKPRRPFYINNTLVANQIRQGKWGKDVPCLVLPDAGIITSFDLSAPLTCFDCAIADAVCTLYQESRSEFSLGQVLRVLSGDRKQTITAQKKQELRTSLDKLRETRLEIRCTQEFRARKLLGQTQELTCQGPVLTLENSGDRYAFSPEGPGPLYDYSRKIHQIITFPEELLQISLDGQKLPDSADIICLKRYLIRRIEFLRYHRKEKTNRSPAAMTGVSFQPDSDLARELGIPARFPKKAARDQKLRRLQAAAVRILTCYRETGYLSSFHTAANGTLYLQGEIRDPWTLSPESGEK